MCTHALSRRRTISSASLRAVAAAKPSAASIRSTLETPRQVAIPQATRRDPRFAVDKHIRNTYPKQVQPRVGAKPTLKCWMQLS